MAESYDAKPGKPGAMDADAILEEAKACFERCVEREAENRENALDDLKFVVDEEQWPAEAKAKRESEGRPCLTINKLKGVVGQVLNDARQNRPSIKVHPVDSVADPATAEVMSGLIRNIEYGSDAEVAYDTALGFAVKAGFGYFRIGIDYASDDTFEKDIRIERIANPFAVYGDPDSTAADSSDWNKAFVVEYLTREQFEKKWKGAEKVDFSSDGWIGQGAPWLDKDGDRVMVAEYWTREEVERAIVPLSNGSTMALEQVEQRAGELVAQGVTVIGEPRLVKSHKVTQRVLTGAEVLSTTEWAGKYIPIVPVYGEDDFIEGRRVLRSIVRSAKDAQRMFNYWRSLSTELVALAPKAPFIGVVGQFDTDAEKWATANTDSHAFIEYDPVAGAPPPQRQPFAGVPAGALQEALNAADDIKAITGIYDASLGARSNETSGRAILARQREGDVATFHFIDNLSRAIRHAGRILIDLIPKVYSTARIVRVLGYDGQAVNVPVNQPVQINGVERVFNLTAGKYDLTVAAGPSYTTQRQEAADQMIELVRAFPQAASVISDLIAKNLDWPGADEIAKRLQALLPPQLREDGQGGGQGPNPEQVKQALARIAQLEQENAELKQDRAAEFAKARNDARKTDIDQFEAETDRLRLVADAMQPTRLPRAPRYEPGF